MALLSSACILGTSRLIRGQPNYEAARLRSQGRQSANARTHKAKFESLHRRIRSCNHHHSPLPVHTRQHDPIPVVYPICI